MRLKGGSRTKFRTPSPKICEPHFLGLVAGTTSHMFGVSKPVFWGTRVYVLNSSGDKMTNNKHKQLSRTVLGTGVVYVLPFSWGQRNASRKIPAPTSSVQKKGRAQIFAMTIWKYSAHKFVFVLLIPVLMKPFRKYGMACTRATSYLHCYLLQTMPHDWRI